MMQLLSVILHSRTISTQTLVYADSLIFSVPFRDRNWSQIHRWTFVNVYSRHVLRECSVAMRKPWSTCRSGAEYWLLESTVGHTINCTGIIWLSTASIPYILHIALRNSDRNTPSNSTAFSFYKINIFDTRMLKTISVFLCVCLCHILPTPMSFVLIERVACFTRTCAT